MRFVLFLLILMQCTTLCGQFEYDYPFDKSRSRIKFPKTNDYFLLSVLYDDDTIFYKLPEVYQKFTPKASAEVRNTTLGTISYQNTKETWGVFDVSFDEKFNANRDFPWEGTVGLNTAIRNGNDRYNTLNYLHLPKDDKGRKIPILVIEEKPIKWIFPVGTVFGEIIMVFQDGQWWTQEVRSRKKTEEYMWEPFVHRPVATREELYKLLKLPDTTHPPSKHFYFRNPEETEVFEMHGLVERLPEIDEQIVKRILSRPFKNVTYTQWSEVSSAPSSDQDFSIVPKDYSLGLLIPDTEVCAQCHRQTQISVRNLIPKEPLITGNPTRVGNIRGSDGIFSWHPFAKNVVRKNEDDPVKPIEYRTYDVKKGIIKITRGATSVDFDKYKLTKYVETSLKKYELPKVRGFLHEESEGPVDYFDDLSETTTFESVND